GRHQRRHPALIDKSADKGPILELVDYLRRDTSTDIDAADRLQYQRHVAGERSIRRNAKVERLLTQFAFVSERCPRDYAGRVIGRKTSGDLRQFRRIAAVAEIFVNVEDPGAGDNPLDAHAIELDLQVLEQGGLNRIARRVIDVPAL